MSQPPVYNRTTSFTTFQTTNPTLPPQGPALDVEFNSIKASLDAIEANLKLIQRDDGALANTSVGPNQLSTALSVGFTAPVAWQTATAYVSSPASTVFNGGKFYSCLVSHTSGTFATDLAAANWVLIADLTAIPLVAANQIAVTASGLLTTDVQGSLQALDSGKAATSHTHVASAISDSTAAGRAMLSAATVAAQQALLGLGAQAFVNNAVVTAIGAQLALTGVISPAALVANTNDWSPTGWATATRVRVSASSLINITGFAATSDGDIKILENVGANAITLTHDDTGSAAANRVTAGANLVLEPGQACLLIYGATSARWRIVASGLLAATSAQATALTSTGVAITPATAQAVANVTIPAYNAANKATTNPFGSQLCYVREEQVTNTTSSNSITSGAFRTLVLNTVKTNEIGGASLATNQVTLGAGTYYAEGNLYVAGGVQKGTLRVRDTTNSVTLVKGQNCYAASTAGFMSLTVSGRFTLAGTVAVELQGQFDSSAAFSALNFSSEPEVYAGLRIWKVA